MSQFRDTKFQLLSHSGENCEEIPLENDGVEETAGNSEGNSKPPTIYNGHLIPQSLRSKIQIQMTGKALTEVSPEYKDDDVSSEV